MKINLLILGGGAIVSQCHLPALYCLDSEQICTVLDPNIYNLEILKKTFPKINIINMAFDSHLLDDHFLLKFNAILIALPNSFHYAACMRCVKLGIPVLCEKPLCLETSEYISLLEHSVNYRCPVFVAMARRYTPSLTILKNILESKMLGKIKSVSLVCGGSVASWPWDSNTVLRIDQGGCLVNMGIHFLDYLELLFGKLFPFEYIDDFKGGIEVNCKLKLKNLDNIPIDIQISWTHSLENLLIVDGERCSAIMDLNKFGSVSIKYKEFGFEGDLSSKNCFKSGDWLYSFESCFIEQFWHFFNYVKGLNLENYLVSVDNALASHRIVEWCYNNRNNNVFANIDNESPTQSLRPKIDSNDVVVTGGTGFIGEHLIKRLSELNMKSIGVAVRYFRNGAKISRYPINMVKIDLLDVESCRLVLRGKRYVFHLAYGNSGDNKEKITILGTRNILKAALLEGVEKIIVFGTCSVWDGYKLGEVDETTTMLSKSGEYAISKSVMIKETLKFAKQNKNIVISIISPGAVYGPGSFFVKMPMESARNGSFFWVDKGSGICNYVYVDNLIDSAIFCLGKNITISDHYIVVDGYTSWFNFLNQLICSNNRTFPSFSANEIIKFNLFSVNVPKITDVFKSVISNSIVRDYLNSYSMSKFFKKVLRRYFLKDSSSVIFSNIKKNNEKCKVGFNPLIFSFFKSGGPIYSSAKITKQLGWYPIISLQEGIRKSKLWFVDIFG